jgi:hypothetical protein
MDRENQSMPTDADRHGDASQPGKSRETDWM